MEPAAEDQLDFGDEEYGGSQTMQYNQGGAIPALADEEMIGDEDEYDDLYNDVNVGANFLQMQRTDVQLPSSGVGNGGSQTSKTNVAATRVEAIAPQDLNNSRVHHEGSYAITAIQHPEQKIGLPSSGGPSQTLDAPYRARLPEMPHNSQTAESGYQGSEVMAPKTTADRMNQPEKPVNEPIPLLNLNISSGKVATQIPPNFTNPNANVNMNRPMIDDSMRPGVENGNTMLFVGELHWWTTDADLESVLIQYGKVKEIKFFEERASGKSKGYCQVEFYDPAAAAACKEGMNGHVFNGRPCVVAFATQHTIRQMGASYANKNQSQNQSQPQGRNPMNDGAGRGNGSNYPTGDGGRNFGRGGWQRGGNQAPPIRGPGIGPIRGRGGMGNKNMMGNTGPGVGYGQGPPGPGFGAPPGMMPPQGMMGPGFDLAFMGRGAGYGFPGPAFPGMLPPYSAVNSMGLPGVAPHVNPAFFGRGMGSNGMGMMGTAGMDGPHSGMWNDTNMGGWGGEEHGRGTRESSYGGEDNASEYGYGEASQDKGVRSSAVSREKERTAEREWSSNTEKRQRDERDHGDRYDKEHRYREEKDRHRDHRHKDRDSGYDDEWDRGHSSRSHSRSRAVPEVDHRSRSKDSDYGKRRRMPSE